jgi:hypothetical protein
VWKRNAREVLGYGFVSAEKNFCPIVRKLFTAQKTGEKVRKYEQNGHKKTRFGEPGLLIKTDSMVHILRM